MRPLQVKQARVKQIKKRRTDWWNDKNGWKEYHRRNREDARRQHPPIERPPNWRWKRLGDLGLAFLQVLWWIIKYAAIVAGILAFFIVLVIIAWFISASKTNMQAIGKPDP